MNPGEKHLEKFSPFNLGGITYNLRDSEDAEDLRLAQCELHGLARDVFVHRNVSASFAIEQAQMFLDACKSSAPEEVPWIARRNEWE